MDMVGKAVLKAVDKAVEERWDRALKLAAAAEGDTAEDRIKSVSKQFRRELTALGAASGAVAAAPGLGTATAASALIADLGWFAMRSTDLVMAIGAVQGHTNSTAEERRAWVLAVLAFGEDAATQFETLVRDLDAKSAVGGEKVSARLASLAGTDVATLDALRRINATLASQVIAKYGSRRSVLAVGKLLPFGIGAVVGGSANYALTRAVGGQAAKFFTNYDRLLPAPASASDAIDSGSDRSARATPPFPDQSQMIRTDQVDAGSKPPPPIPGSQRLPNPSAHLTDSDKQRSIPTDGRKND